METTAINTETIGNKNTAIAMQLSALTQYFIPLGNYIFPTIIWSLKKDQSEFVNQNGKNIINFQLSLLLYYFILGVTAVCLLIYAAIQGTGIQIDYENNYDWTVENFTTGNVTAVVVTALTALGIIAMLKLFEFFLIIYAAVKNSNGENYKYPLTINFIK